VGRLDLHGGLVGLDLGDDVAGLDLVALLLDPLGEVALFHGGRQRGHQYGDRHRCSSARRNGTRASRSGHQRTTSAQSSAGSGSGSWVAKSAASLMILRMSASIFFSSSSLARLVASSRARTCSIGSCSVRTFSTSSRVRYFAGSDIEWPRY